jgi:hypothetical protein
MTKKKIKARQLFPIPVCPNLADPKHLEWEKERQSESGSSWIQASWEHGMKLTEEEYKTWSKL